MPLFEIGDIIDETESEIRDKIAAYTVCLENLRKWKHAYEEELSGIQKISRTSMPPSLRIGRSFSEEEHIAHYLKGRIQIEKEDWKFVSLSFYYDMNENPEKIYKYISLKKTTTIEKKNSEYELVEETSEDCLSTQVYYSENIHDMISPLLEFT